MAVGNIDKEIGARIKELRRSRLLTNRQLGLRLYLTEKVLINIQEGRRQITVELLIAIAKALDVPLTDLLPPRYRPMSVPMQQERRRIISEMRDLCNQLEQTT